MSTLRSWWSNPRLLLLIVVFLLILSFIFRPASMAHIQVPAETILELGGLHIANTLLAAWLGAIVLLVGACTTAHSLKLVPDRKQALLEALLEYMLDLVESVAGRSTGRAFFPLIATIFLFLIVVNWMGILPGYSTIGVWQEIDGHRVLVPLLRSASTDLNLTVGIALLTFVAVQYAGLRYVGTRRYLSRFINFSGPVQFLIGFMEIISEISRVLSLSFRLFGNVFAGEVLLGVIGFLVPFVAVLPFYGLELFVGAVQAFIFSLLALIFVTLAATDHEVEHS